jgi:hypothetical protein
VALTGISTAGAIILKISHGYQVSETEGDPLVTLAETTMHEFNKAATPGTFLVDSLPWRVYPIIVASNATRSDIFEIHK